MSDINPKIAVWVKRLSSSSKLERQEAIRGLKDIGIEDALFPLATLFASDPDEETRLLAQEAGKSIYLNLHRQAQITRSASDEERQKAADILAKAHAKKMKRR